MSREHYLDGGVYPPGDDDHRTDFYLKESPSGTVCDLHVVSGNADFCVVEILPADLLRLADFLKGVAEEMRGRTR